MDAPEIRLRESPRVAVLGRARLFPAAGPEVEARLLDISTTGMGLASDSRAPAGEAWGFELGLDGVTFEGRGVVVWSRRSRADREDAPNLGIRFESVDPRGAASIRSLIERRLADRRRPPTAAAPADRAAAPEQTAASTVERNAAAKVTSKPVPPIVAPPEQGIEAPPEQGIEAPPERGSPRRVGLGAALVAVVAVVILVVVNRPSRDGGTASSSALPPPAAEPAPMQVAADGVPSTAETAAPPPAPLPTSAAREVDDSPRSDSVAPAEAPSGGAKADTGRARRLVALEAGLADSEEVLTLRADGPLRRQDVFAALMGIDPPRYLLRLSGIERQWRRPSLEVGSPLIQRVRTGLHSGDRGPELHVVIDLVSRAVEPSWEIDGDTLRVRLRPRTP